MTLSLLTLPLWSVIGGLPVHIGKPGWLQMLNLMGAYLLVAFVVVCLARALQPLHGLYQRIRQDWTLLPFGLFFYAANYFTSHDQRDSQTLTWYVLLPPLIVMMGALICLLTPARWPRFLWLIISLTLAFAVRTAAGDVYYWELYWGVLALITVPALLGLWPRRALDMQISRA